MAGIDFLCFRTHPRYAYRRVCVWGRKI